MIMTKVPEHPRVHDFRHEMAFSVEPSIDNDSTMIPLVTYSEQLGIINSYKSNPQNTSHAEYAGAKCYPTSKVSNIFAKTEFAMTKEALETDKIHQIKIATMQIFTSFMDGELALDEVSTLDLNEILELQNEQTNRETYPLYNTHKMLANKFNANLDLEVDQQGLTTDLEIEGVDFDENVYYDCLHYFTNANKMRAMTTGLKWHTLTRQKPTHTVYWRQDSKTKFMNQYTGNFALIHVPTNTNMSQYGKALDTTANAVHVSATTTYRYNEFNHFFNHSLQ